MYNPLDALDTVGICYNMVIHLQNAHRSHPIAWPWGWAMGVFLDLRYSDAIWTSWCLKSSATGLFGLLFSLVISKVCVTGPLWGESNGWLPPLRASNTEMVSISWNYYAKSILCSILIQCWCVHMVSHYAEPCHNTTKMDQNMLNFQMIFGLRGINKQRYWIMGSLSLKEIS